jgi:hypothetical protein
MARWYLPKDDFKEFTVWQKTCYRQKRELFKKRLKRGGKIPTNAVASFPIL